MSATNRGAKRVANDFYPTPGYTIDSMLNLINWNEVNTFLEPCKGDNAIYNKVPDTVDKHWCELSLGRDYLESIESQEYDLIVTNPPFSIADQFIQKSLSESKTVCYLLRLNYFGAQKRNKWWNEIGTPNKLLVLSRRPKFINNQADATEYAWFCWDKQDIINLPDGIHVIW